MQADPIGEVRGLYAWLGEPVTDEFEAGMRRWWTANAENREPGAHSDPATFGLDLDRGPAVVRRLRHAREGLDELIDREDRRDDD